MEINIWAKKIFLITLSVASFIETIYSLGNFFIFISFHGNTSKGDNMLWISEKESASVLPSLLVNLSLLSLFVLQHSIMASPEVKLFLHGHGWQVAERSIYNICTASSLLLVTHYWRRMPSSLVWCIDTAEHQWAWWIFSMLHSIAWFIIYGGSLTMDCMELMGIKRVFYYVLGWADPLALKSLAVSRLYQHMRHPSFIGFSILLWIHPLMSVDRLLLAVVLTLYMICAWSVDTLDHQYTCKQLAKKQYLRGAGI